MLAAFLLIAAATASGATDPDAGTSSADAAATEGPALSRRERDAAVSRGMVSSRAETVGEGRLVVNSHDLVVLGATYGFSDDLQASITGLLPVVDGLPQAAFVQAKVVVWRRPRWVGAVRGVGGAVHQGASDHTAATFAGGGLVDWQPTEHDGLTLHAGLTLGSGVGQSVSDVVDLSEGTALLGEFGVELRAHRRLSLMAEIWLPSLYNVQTGALDSLPFALVPYGLRFTGSQVSVDVGFIKGLGGIDTDAIALGLPHVAASVGFGGRATVGER